MKHVWLLIALLSASFLSASEASQDVRNAGIKVCAIENPVFFSRTEEGTVGFSHDILSGFAEFNDRQIEVVWLDAEKLGGPIEDFALLDSGKCDVLAMMITMTEERDELVDFSEPYFPIRGILIEPKGQHSADLDALAGKKVAVIKGVLYEQMLKQHSDIQIVYGNSPQELFELLSSGRADALAADSWTIGLLDEEYKDLSVTSSLTETQTLGFVFVEGSPLRAELDTHIRRMKGDGSFRSALVTHFGEESADLIIDALGAEWSQPAGE
ncbi:MAG: transporter substrate-binding domain-containing protein [bacterium]|nr:transporter substrate-binding domain-containing protein [bacterium]